MFFAPPNVKSLSRYSEFGIYLKQRHFFIMLGAAIVVHLTIIGIYALGPRDEVMKIPVRVLNIKLGNGDANVMEVAPEEEEQTPKPKESKKTEAQEYYREKTVESELDKALAKKTPVKAASKKEVADKPVTNENKKTLHPFDIDAAFAKPKKYVREATASDSTQPHAATPSAAPATSQPAAQQSGAAMLGATDPAGTEIVQRYEESISLWIQTHKIYPEAARRQGIEGDATVRIRINREGRILYNAIERSSGNTLIDEAVIDMVRKSDPVPPAPQDYPAASQLEFLIPVSFHLN